MSEASFECRGDASSQGKQDSVGAEDLSRSIRSIDRGTVHQICSGQVITSLGTAVKELVENSVDAGASNIEIRLKDYGCELIEVIDNGDGVMEVDFQGLALKHHTSKLRNFSDLSEMETFGFRGEALSSLCALGNVTITTRHKDAKVGSRLFFDHDGILVSQVHCPRDVGTSVSIQQLFMTLPVRHKEFLRNKKREFGKLCQILHAYGIISIDVRMTCTNQLGKGKKNIVLTTPGNSSMRENILSIFGTKQANSLVQFVQEKVTSDTAEEFGVAREFQTGGDSLFLVEGYVSSASHGSGRSCTDRQFFFINRRPCDLARVSKLVNEAYHMFNRHQYPFVALSITSKMDAVDVNVTPDKRQIFLHQEKILLAVLKSSLKVMFEKHASTLDIAVVAKRELNSPKPQTQSCVKEKQNIQHFSVQPGSPLSVVDDFVQDNGSNHLSGAHGFTIIERESPSNMLSATERNVSTEEALSDFDAPKGNSFCEFESTEMNSTLPAPTMSPPFSSEPLKGLPVVNGRVGFTKLVSDCKLSKAAVYASGRKQSPLKQRRLTDCFKKKTPLRIKSTVSGSCSLVQSGISTKDSSDWLGEETTTSVSHFDVEKEEEEESPVFGSLADDIITGDSALKSQTKGILWTPRKRLKTELLEESGRPVRTVPFDLNAFEQRWPSCRRESPAASTMASSFHARITPDQNQEAESELQCHVTKEMFGRMKIIGQFNLGFIIAQLGPDLFIIDQHATDEKYNFERLQREQTLESQRLITPKVLELTASNEAVLLDNLKVFKLNGFDFTVKEDALVGRRVSLISQPISKNWNFGTEDVEELIFMLTDAPGSLCRPSRVRQMFASRACRSSVMIGKPLTAKLMKKLVVHMGELEQPWNCPHGRPTMRHLISIGRIAR